MMPVQRSGQLDSWMLVAATAVFVLSAERYFREAGLIGPGPRHLPQANVAHATTEPHHGSRFKGPFDIPGTGWKDILRRTYRRIDDDRLLATAGGVVFFGLLAIFPAVTALVSSYGLLADPSTISDNLQTLAMMLPAGTFEIVQDQVARVVSKGNGTLGATFLFGLVLAIWSANAGVKSIFDALNVAYETREKRGFVRLNLISLTFTVGAIAALSLMVGAVVAFPLALDHLGIAPESKLIVALARWPLLLVILLAALAILYRFAPSREAPPWRWLSVGAVTAALLWIAGSALLSWYLSAFANYSATYGSLGAAIGLMMWMWMSAIVVMFGAELNSEIERQCLIAMQR